MSSYPKHRYTLEEYFALELSSETKYEYWNGEVFAMSGVSPEHAQIQINLTISLGTQMRGGPCRVFPSDLRIKVPAYLPYRYPDLSALCGEAQYEKMSGLDVLINPALIIEILSPTTEAFDRGDKFTYYKSIPSFTEYLLVAQHRPYVGQYIKVTNEEWRYYEFNDMDGVVNLSSVNCRLTLSEIYEDVTFKPSMRPGL
jgi:Uma2 family endonuclease